jgi:urease accessory protein
VIDATDVRLLESPVGLHGMRCIASLFFATGSKLDRHRKERALDCARGVIAAHSLAGTAGVTSPNAQVLVVRVLAPLVEPAMDLLRTLRSAWRQELWSVAPSNPRIWSM